MRTITWWNDRRSRSRSWWGNSAVYWELDYYLENGSGKIPFRIFVSEDYFVDSQPPSKIRIGNSGGRLYMAFFPIDYDKPEEDHAVVFVYQPSQHEDKREIYQKRFHMGLNNLVEAVMSSGGGAGWRYGSWCRFGFHCSWSWNSYWCCCWSRWIILGWISCQTCHKQLHWWLLAICFIDFTFKNRKRFSQLSFNFPLSDTQVKSYHSKLSRYCLGKFCWVSKIKTLLNFLTYFGQINLRSTWSMSIILVSITRRTECSTDCQLLTNTK